MTEPTAPRTALELVIAPALETYGEALAAHRHAHDVRTGASCTCGFTGTGRYPARSVGLHISAAHKRASKAYDAEAAVALERLNRMTAAERRQLEADALIGTEEARLGVAEELTAAGVVPTLTVTPAAAAVLDQLTARLTSTAPAAEAPAHSPEDPMPTAAALRKRAKDGDADAIDELVTRYHQQDDTAVLWREPSAVRVRAVDPLIGLVVDVESSYSRDLGRLETRRGRLVSVAYAQPSSGVVLRFPDADNKRDRFVPLSTIRRVTAAAGISPAERATYPR